MTSSIEREVLEDILHHKGSTRNQIRDRLSTHSPVTVNRTIESLIDLGYLSYQGTVRALELTKEGLDALYPEKTVIE